MNPIAVVMIVLGGLLLLVGMSLVHRNLRVSGIVISVVGLGAIGLPFLVSFYLAKAAP